MTYYATQLSALISKGALIEIEVIAILDAAAGSAEKAPDKLGGKYSKSTGLTIRQILNQFLDAPERAQKH